MEAPLDVEAGRKKFLVAADSEAERNYVARYAQKGVAQELAYAAAVRDKAGSMRQPLTPGHVSQVTIKTVPDLSIASEAPGALRGHPPLGWASSTPAAMCSAPRALQQSLQLCSHRVCDPQGHVIRLTAASRTGTRLSMQHKNCRAHDCAPAMAARGMPAACRPPVVAEPPAVAVLGPQQGAWRPLHPPGRAGTRLSIQQVGSLLCLFAQHWSHALCASR